MEQAYLRFSLNPRQYFVAGLFVPRMGILIEDHLPANGIGGEAQRAKQAFVQLKKEDRDALLKFLQSL